MLNYVIRRLLYSIPILLGVIAITFILDSVMVTPDQKASRVLGPKVGGRTKQEWIHNRGLDRPMPEQFVRTVKNLVTFQFGTSWVTQRELREVFMTGVGGISVDTSRAGLASARSLWLSAMPCSRPSAPIIKPCENRSTT